MTYEKYKVTIPEGKAGDWEVKRFTVSEEDAKFDMMRSMYSFSSRGRYTPAGTYTSLTYRGATIMSDTPDEIKDFKAIRMARGSVLINGLGLGVVLQAVLEKPEVTDVTVIELSPDVITLIGKHYLDKYGAQLQIINTDAFIKNDIGKSYLVMIFLGGVHLRTHSPSIESKPCPTLPRPFLLPLQNPFNSLKFCAGAGKL